MSDEQKESARATLKAFLEDVLAIMAQDDPRGVIEAQQWPWVTELVYRIPEANAAAVLLKGVPLITINTRPPNDQVVSAFWPDGRKTDQTFKHAPDGAIVFGDQSEYAMNGMGIHPGIMSRVLRTWMVAIEPAAPSMTGDDVELTVTQCVQELTAQGYRVDKAKISAACDREKKLAYRGKRQKRRIRRSDLMAWAGKSLQKHGQTDIASPAVTAKRPAAVEWECVVCQWQPETPSVHPPKTCPKCLNGGKIAKRGPAQLGRN